MFLLYESQDGSFIHSGTSQVKVRWPGLPGYVTRPKKVQGAASADALRENHDVLSIRTPVDI
jgi:hypothetical protein